MKSLTASLLLLSLLQFTGPALALDCSSPSNQSDMNLCATNDLKRQNQKLNESYNAIRAKLDPKQKQDLKQVQLAWIKFRDMDCKFEASGVQGGSAYPMVLSACLSARTIQRDKELGALLNCQEGDLSCPAH